MQFARSEDAGACFGALSHLLKPEVSRVRQAFLPLSSVFVTHRICVYVLENPFYSGGTRGVK